MSVDITRLTAHLSPEQQDEVKRAYRRRHENSTAAFLWCFFFGTLGAHRFYLKQWGAGFVRLLVPLIAAAVIVAGIVFNLQPAIIVTVVIVLLLIALIWEIIDLFRIDHEVYERNLKLAESLIGDSLLADKTVERQADTKMETLMLDAQAEATASAQAERQEVAADAAAAVPPVAAAVAERETGAASDENEAVGAEEEQRSEAMGAAGDTYVAHTVTEISDDPNATQHAVRYQTGPQNDWSETETVHAEDEQVRTAEDEGTETISEPGAIGAAGVALGTAAVAGYALDEAITRTHSETNHSTADSLETHATLSAAAAEQQDEAVAAEAADTPPPPLTEAEAATWPDHPPVVFDEPAPAAPQTATTFDVTDTTGVSGGVKPIADIEPEAAPLIIALPALASMAETSEAEAEPAYADTALVEPMGAAATDVYAASAVPAPEAGDEMPLRMVPVADAEETSFGGSPSVDAPVWAEEPDAVPADSYVPPTVPVVSAEPEAEPEPEQHTGETLAELAAFAGAAGVGVAAAEALSHRPEDQPQPTLEPEAPAAEEPAPAPSAPEPAPVIAAAAPAATETAAAAMAQPRRQLRRIREHLEIKREGQVVEELVGEELIEIDQDPEPVRLRLRDQLHRQAVERGLE